MRPAPPGDHGEILQAERVVQNEIRLARGQCEQAVKLGIGDDMATRHGRRVPMEVR